MQWGRTGKSLKHRWATLAPTTPECSLWTPAEDRLLLKLVQKNGPTLWDQKAVKFGGARTASSLAKRWRRLQNRVPRKPRQTGEKRKVCLPCSAMLHMVL